MMKRQNGFSLIELLIVIAIMGFVLAGASQMFIAMLRGYKTQSSIAETNIEGIIGLDLLRRDIESAGYGLPWAIPSVGSYSTYKESAAGTYAQTYDDTPNPPRALLAGNNMTDAAFVNGTDYLVIKSVDVAGNDASMKWSYLPSDGVPEPVSATAAEKLNGTDNVIVMSPGTSSLVGSRTLLGWTTYSNNSVMPTFKAPNMTQLIYGISESGTIQMPFNRADYYVGAAPSGLPQRCAQGTGILYKAVMSQANGTLTQMPLLDCVADMQVVTFLDVPGTGETAFDGLVPTPALTAQTIRNELREVHVFILAQEGVRDPTYTYPSNSIQVGEIYPDPGGTLYGRSFTLSTIGDPNWQNYRWKVYTLVVHTYNVR